MYAPAVHRAMPMHNISPYLPKPTGRTVVMGACTAAGAMAHAVEALWPSDVELSGLVVTRYDRTPLQPPSVIARIEIVEAAHPVPDAAGMASA